MVIEHFKSGEAARVYRRFREKGRMAPPGVNYVSSWVTDDLTKCYQIMEADGLASLESWTANWSDLVDFEIVPVITFEEYAQNGAGRRPNRCVFPSNWRRGSAALCASKEAADRISPLL